jgi:DNA-directed RNA polymerase subunit RPC12/RpoP
MEEPQLTTRACTKCGKVLDVRGIGTHQRYCNVNTPTEPNGPGIACPQCGSQFKNKWGLDVHTAKIHKTIDVPKERSQGVAKMWTISLVNGNRQIAGTVPEYVAQRIVRMLI